MRPHNKVIAFASSIMVGDTDFSWFNKSVMDQQMDQLYV